MGLKGGWECECRTDDLVRYVEYGVSKLCKVRCTCKCPSDLSDPNKYKFPKFNAISTQRSSEGVECFRQSGTHLDHNGEPKPSYQYFTVTSDAESRFYFSDVVDKLDQILGDICDECEK